MRAALAMGMVYAVMATGYALTAWLITWMT